MNVEQLRDYCLKKPGVSEGFPFGEDVLVFKVSGKMFALSNLARETAQVNLKCDPERAVQLRAEHPQDIRPGYHMNKQHWNTVSLEGGLRHALLTELIDLSYDLVVSSLSKKLQDQLKER